MVDLREYERMRERPPGRPVMFQRWRSLLFLHFSAEPAEIQRLLPAGLTVDTFDGKAWVGLVPFRIEGARPRFLPPFPPVGDFPETNVRTYAHFEGRDPGVWFFSLDAASRVACWAARTFFSLPYFAAEMSMTDVPPRYDSVRRDGGFRCHVQAELGEALGVAEPGTLEYFLVERYLLYAYRDGQLFSGRVHHSPYPLRDARPVAVAETLTQAAGIVPQPYVHSLASDGVDVEVWPLRKVR